MHYRKLYWSDWSRVYPRIMVANMDGTEPRAFVKDDIYLPNDVKVDLYYRRLCYLDAGKGS